MARDAQHWVSCFHSVRDLPNAGTGQCQRPWREVTGAAAPGAGRWCGWEKGFLERVILCWSWELLESKLRFLTPQSATGSSVHTLCYRDVKQPKNI